MKVLINSISGSIRTILYLIARILLRLISLGESNDRILLIKVDAIGDFVIFSKYLKCYSEIYKNYKIDLVINKINCELAKDCDFIQNVIPVDKDKFINDKKYKYSLFIRLAKAKYKLAVYPVYSREVIGDKLAIFSGAREILTFSGNTANIPENLKKVLDKFYTTILETENEEKHEEIRNLELLRKLGYKGDDFRTFVKFSENDRKIVYELMGYNEEDKFVVIVPGGGAKIRYWGEDKYSEVVEKVIQRGFKVLLCGSEKEKSIIDGILENIKLTDNPSILNLAGRTNIHQLAMIISLSNIYIGSETSAVHFAELFKTPSICIIGGGHYGRFYPYPGSEIDYPMTVKLNCFNCNWNCSRGDIKCIKGVEVEDVIGTFDRLQL